MQIKRDKRYSLMLVYLKINCINKQSPYYHQATRYIYFPNIFVRHFTNVCNLLSPYNNGRILTCQYQWVMLRNNDMLF